jgi:uncharacterized protein (TIGR00251 family)
MALIITLKIVPASGKMLWVYDKQGRIKLFVKNPAQQGKANKEVIKIIAQALHIPQASISIISGQTAPLKIIKIDAIISLTKFLQSVGLDVQQPLLQ